MLHRTPVNVGAFIIHQFQCRTTHRGGSINMSALLTPIAQHLQLDLDDLEAVPGNTHLTRRTIHAMGLVQTNNSGIKVFIFKGSDF